MTIEYAPPEVYRGVQIQNFQTRERIEKRVKAEIDHVLGPKGHEDLMRYCGDISCPPEARLLAAAMLHAIFSQAADNRRVRPDINLVLVEASVGGLDEWSHWRSPWSYGCIMDDAGPPYGPGEPRPEMRPVPLTDEQLWPLRNAR